jgi:ATF/CREB family transcription factor
VVNLKTLLLAHKDCPIAQQQGLQGGFVQVVEPYGGQMNPYGMAAPIPPQGLIAGPGRRYS